MSYSQYKHHKENQVSASYGNTINAAGPRTPIKKKAYTPVRQRPYIDMTPPSQTLPKPTQVRLQVYHRKAHIRRRTLLLRHNALRLKTLLRTFRYDSLRFLVPLLKHANEFLCSESLPGLSCYRPILAHRLILVCSSYSLFSSILFYSILFLLFV